MDERERERERLRRNARKHFEKRVDPEENKRRKRSAKERRERRTDRPRRRRFEVDVEDDDLVDFEPIRRPKRTSPGDDASGIDAVPAAWHARVVAVHRDRAVVRDAAGRELDVRPTRPVVVGDRVGLDRVGPVPAVAAVAPRRSVLRRRGASPGGERLLAANVDDVVVVLAAGRPKVGLVDRVRVALGAEPVRLVACVNKADTLDAPARAALARLLAPLEPGGVPVFLVSAAAGEGLDGLAEALRGRTAVLVGPSGVGKSSLLNALAPHADRATGAVRRGDGKGRHTTTSSALVDLEGGGALIDTPGIRTFGLGPVPPDEAAAAFPEFARVGPCRFGDCTHRAEPDCAVREAAGRGEIAPDRLASYLRLLEDD